MTAGANSGAPKVADVRGRALDPTRGRVNLDDPASVAAYKRSLYQEHAVGAVVFGAPIIYGGEVLLGARGALGGVLIACVFLWYNVAGIESRLKKAMEFQKFLSKLNL